MNKFIIARLLYYILIDIVLRVIRTVQWIILRNYTIFLRVMMASPTLVDVVSPHAAMYAALRAYKRIPAYRAFLQARGWRDDVRINVLERIQRLPLLDKVTYIQEFSIEKRCIDGNIPLRGVKIDESSGTSGASYNWVRSVAELENTYRTIGHFVRYLVGDKVIAINAFSMGAWVTGTGMGEALLRNGVVKSTGPDISGIIETLTYFGSVYSYVITGYPPFLKRLLDEGEIRGLDWMQYDICALVGGEAISEELRVYLRRGFRSIFSGYGAADFGIGIACETPLAVWIRQQAAINTQLRHMLFGEESRLPMIFQYNPLDYYVEVNRQREILVTTSHTSVISPLIRYNIRDVGDVCTFTKMLDVLHSFALKPPKIPILKLPFLYIFGRSDNTISYWGMNIYPEDIQQALFSDTSDARTLGAFCLEILELDQGVQRPCIHVEILADQYDDSLALRLRERVYTWLLTHNHEFRALVVEDVKAIELQIELHYAGMGPFADRNNRIKLSYIR